MEGKIVISQTSGSFPIGQTEIEGEHKLENISATSIVFVIFTAIAILTSAYTFRRWQHRLILKSVDRNLCHGCQYFNNNHYLQCAIQPQIVMTAQSIDCRDHTPMQSAKPIGKISKIFLKVYKSFFG
jgi:hypothetical protein